MNMVKSCFWDILILKTRLFYVLVYQKENFTYQYDMP